MGLHVVRQLGDLKARVGVDNTVEWSCPDPVDPAGGGAPVMVVHLASGPVSVALTSSGAITLVSLTDGRRLLTYSGTDPLAGWGGRQGEAWIVTGSVQYPVRVKEIDRTAKTIRLAEPLGSALPGDDPGSLVPSYYQGEVLAADVTASLARNVRWTISWEADWTSGGEGVPRQETGLLQIVSQPFGTGVGATDLGAYMRTVGPASGPSEEAWESAVEMGEAELILWLREQLAERDLTEDDVPAPQVLRLPHLMFSASSALMISDPDTSATLRLRAQELSALAVRRLWIDSDQDGEVDAGEVQQLGGDRSRDVRSTSRGTRVPKFSIGGAH